MGVATCNGMDESCKTLCWCERSQSQRLHTVWFHLYEISRIGKSVEIKSTLVIARQWGRGEMWLLIGVGFLFGVMEIFWNLLVVLVNGKQVIVIVNVLKITDMYTFKPWILFIWVFIYSFTHSFLVRVPGWFSHL